MHRVTTKLRTVRLVTASAILALGAASISVGIAGASARHAHTAKAHASLVTESPKPTDVTPTGVVTTTPVTPVTAVTAVTASVDTSGVITAVTSSSITIQDESGASITYALDATTTITADGNTSALSALSVGTTVDISTADNSSALNIDIQLAHAEGHVVSVNGNTIVLSTDGGGTETILVGTATSFTMNDASATLADVTTGSSISVDGTVGTSATTIDALNITIDQSDEQSTQSGDNNGASISVGVSASLDGSISLNDNGNGN